MASGVIVVVLNKPTDIYSLMRCIQPFLKLDQLVGHEILTSFVSGIRLPYQFLTTVQYKFSATSHLTVTETYDRKKTVNINIVRKSSIL